MYNSRMVTQESIFLEIDRALKLEGGIFGNQWKEVRKKQIIFLLERPLMFKVLTEKVWGPARLDSSVVDEWWEAEREERSSNKAKEVYELADMTLLFLTSDSLNPNLMLQSQIKLLKTMAKDSTVKSYCEAIGITEYDLIPICEKKIKINELRNPQEAFLLVANEDMQTSIKRMDHNWNMLKEKRNILGKQIKESVWWKKTLYVDEGGWVRER